LHGREVLKKGIIKRIGPGSSVNIWQNNWIPGIHGFKQPVRLPGVMVNTVDELFEDGTRRWNLDIVRQCFIGIDAEEVLKIQQSQTMEEDVEAWAHERSGRFSCSLGLQTSETGTSGCSA
jgi:hypothetical protein